MKSLAIMALIVDITNQVNVSLSILRIPINNIIVNENNSIIMINLDKIIMVIIMKMIMHMKIKMTMTMSIILIGVRNKKLHLINSKKNIRIKKPKNKLKIKNMNHKFRIWMLI